MLNTLTFSVLMTPYSPSVPNSKPFSHIQQKIIFAILTTSIFIAMVLTSALATADPTKIHAAFPDQVIFVSKLNADDTFDTPFNPILEEVFKRANLDWERNNYPAARMFRLLETGVANFSILVKSPLLDKCCVVSNLPITTTELRVYHKKGVAEIITVDTLKEKDIITIRGYSYGALREFIKNPENKVKISNTAAHTSAFAMLNQGRADYLLDYKHPSIVVLRKHPIKDIQFETLEKIDVHLVLHKDYPNAKQVMAQLEAIMQSLDIERIMSLPTDPE